MANSKMVPKVKTLKAADLTVGMTITFLKYEGFSFFVGTPCDVLSICTPFIIVDSFGKTKKVDLRKCTIGLPTDAYVQAYTNMYKKKY